MSNSRRRGMNPILAFILGFFLAFIIMVGAVVGGVFFALNYKLDKLSINKDENGNYLFINADPSSGGVATVLDLIKKLTEMSKGYSNLTLGELEVLMPVMGTVTEKLETSLEEFIDLEENELREVPLGSVSEYVNGLVNRINVAKLIGADPSEAIVTYMCYGVYGLEKTEDGVYTAKYSDGENVYDCVLELDDTNLITGVYYELDGEKVYTPYLTLDNAKTRIKGVCEDLTVGEIVPIQEGDRILSAIKSSTVNTLSDDINNLSVQQIFVDEIYARETAKEGEQTPEANIYLAVANEEPDVATEYQSDLIYYVKDADSGEYTLAGNNGKLTVEEYADYGTKGTILFTLGEGRILYSESFLYYTLTEDGGYVMVENAEGAGRADAPLNGEEIYTYGAPSPLWKLLLYIDGKETAFTFNNINSMIANISNNTQNTSMRELDAAGILTFDNKQELELDIVYYDSERGKVTEKLGDMALAEVIGVAVYYFTTFSQLII